MLQQLQGASGPDFDRRYVQLQLAAHQDSVLLFEKYGQNGDNPQLKQFAQQMLPDLQAHLQQVQQIRSALPPEPVAQGQSTSPQTVQAPAAPMTAPAGASGGQLLTAMQPGQFRASKLIGVNIYGSEQGNRNDTDKIGDINEVIVDRMGQIQAVVIGVGGFLGIGEKDVAIPFNQIEWRTSEEVRTSTNTAAPGASGGTAARTDTAAPGAAPPAGRSGDASTTGTVARSDQAAANQATPDRGYIRMSKADLQNAPTFRYDARDASRSTQPGSTTAPAGSTAPATRP
jgi:hypothetical protein